MALPARRLASRGARALAIALLVVSGAPGPAAAARGARPATAAADSVLRLDAVLDSLRLARGVPGLAAAVIERGRLVAIGAAGVPYAGATRALTVRDPLHVGSCTKSMTALAMAQLVEKRRLQWSTTMAQAFPELLSDILPVYRNVRLDQLLTHRGGIPPYDDVAESTLIELNAAGYTPTSIRHEFVRRVVNEAPVHEPGAAYDYSNAGYTLAAAMAENLTGKSWEYWLQELVFAPLGLTTAGFGWPADKSHRDRPRGHRCADGAGLEPEPLDTAYRLGAALGPGGDVHLSIADLARYVAFQLDGAEGRPTRPALTAASWQRLHEDPEGASPGYAMGWQVLPGDAVRPMLVHDGTAGTFYTRILIEPARDRAVVIATNAGPPCGRAACEQGLGVVLAWVGRMRR
jgi:CubicO group peptidase (beta-lactamase class C family)